MKKTNKVQKLKINPETLRTLKTSELAAVQGGMQGVTNGWWCNKVDFTLSGGYVCGSLAGYC
jgi:hypothetical protein